MKPQPLWPQLVLISLSVVSLLGLASVASALAVLPPTARHDQKSLQAISHNVQDTRGVDTASGIETLPDEHITAQAVIKHIDIPAAVSPPPTSAPSTNCTKNNSTKSILKTFVVSTVKATKNFPSTLYNFITATHPERHPHLGRRAKRDLNHEDPKLSETVDYAGKILVDVEKATMRLIEAWAESKYAFCYVSGSQSKQDLKHEHEEDGPHVHVKRDLNDMDDMNEMNDLETKDDPKLIKAVEKAGEIIKEGWEFILHLAALLVASLHFF